MLCGILDRFCLRASVVLRISFCTDFSVKMSYPKRSKDDNTRASKPPKRRFHGNQYLRQEDEPVGESASARKLFTASTSNISCAPAFVYRIIEFVSFFDALSEIVVCKDCKKKGEIRR